MGGNRGMVFSNNCRIHMDKTKVGWNQGRAVGMAGVGGIMEGKGRNCTEQQ